MFVFFVLKYLDDWGGAGSQQLFGLQDGEEGVGALESQARQESPHHGHHRVIQAQPPDQVLQGLIPERTEKCNTYQSSSYSSVSPSR